MSSRGHHDRAQPPPVADCQPEAWSGEAGADAGSAWGSARAERRGARERISQLVQTLEAQVIPRLVDLHAVARTGGVVQGLSADEIEAFVELLRVATDDEVSACVAEWHRRGQSVQTIFLEGFAPAAHHLGVLWVTDRCDFATVTVCLGRLQRLLRDWSPLFGNEVRHPPNGRRLLLAQHPDEQHSFGLSMVAEFFRRDGWEVLGGVGGAVPDPSALVAREWFDVVGYSVGSQTRLDWVADRIAQVRRTSRNQRLLVMLGGPLAVVEPASLEGLGADIIGGDGARAPAAAEALLVPRPAAG